MRPSALLVVCLLVLCENSLPRHAQAQEDKAPKGVDPKMTSTDPDYGYSKNKPIKVGSKDELGGPDAEHAYLKSLRDGQGKPIKFRRVASVGANSEGHIIDLYEVTTSSGKKVELFMDMYHPQNAPENQLAPKGCYKAKK
jgi:hypothetical protein